MSICRNALLNKLTRGERFLYAIAALQVPGTLTHEPRSYALLGGHIRMAFLQAGFPAAAAGATGHLNSGALYPCASATHAALSGLRTLGSKIHMKATSRY